ncbi:SDR family NAD(P)-dependent oxidoreductase [Pseudonocardia sp. ICBG1293]|uniref:SDR family NAD(P)-dependent oxidoreductase n=1 Tax=Pseudonocardia sp. ICBG1293 TaxID=2844382 RepID=UPI001CCF72E5|nr:SDR family NAD(P)-dependent oxidoreductase [Pseudonocardia sp. ICBG1293]
MGTAHGPGAGDVAVVTGATSGIGFAIARGLLAAGLTVYVGAREPGRGAAAVAALGAGARPLDLEVTDPASVAAAAAGVPEVDLLVNNAGVGDDLATAVDCTAEDLRRVYEVNVFGVVTVTNAFLPALRRSAHPRVLNVSSGTGSLTWSTGPNPQFDHRGGGGAAAYRSSKAALNALTVYYSQALADAGIPVNALAPGLRATNLNARAAASGGDPAEAADGAVALLLTPDGGPTGTFVDWTGTPVPW